MLTAQQEQFAKNIALKEMNQADAYRDAYNAENMQDGTIYTEASLLKDNPKVAKRIQELRDSLAEPEIMSAKERLKWLSGLIKSENESTRDKLSASDQMNKMQGEYIQKVEANITYEDKLKDVVDEDEY